MYRSRLLVFRQLLNQYAAKFGPWAKKYFLYVFLWAIIILLRIKANKTNLIEVQTSCDVELRKGHFW